MSNGPRPESMMRLGRWSLLRVVGRGGMGYVYEGIDDDGRRAAVKVLDRILAAERSQIERFRREAEILRRLDHPNLLALHEAEEAEGVPYLVTDLVLGPEGRAITFDWILAEGRTDLATRLDLFEQSLDALAHVHRRGLVHRDFKPSNVLVEELRGGSLRARLVDFGIAAPIGGVDPSGSGTPRYMAPELRSREAAADVRADVYAAGVFLHEVLTGEAPGEGEGSIPEPYRSIVDRAMAWAAEARYPDAASLATELALARLEPALELSEETRGCLSLLHRARGLELELEGDAGGAVRHYRIGERFAATARPAPRRPVLRTGLAAAFLAIVAGLGFLWVEADAPYRLSRGRYRAARRHLEMGERLAAERSLAGSFEPDSTTLLERLIVERRAAEEAVELMMARIESALRAEQYEEALDLIAERSFAVGPEGLAHAHLVEARGRDYLEESVWRARALLAAGDRAGARKILVEASQVVYGGE